MSLSSAFAKTLIGVLAITNPVGAIPIFLGLCGDRDAGERRVIAGRAAMAVAIILVICIWLGSDILAFFGIGLPAFRAAGGILILLMAISMLHAHTSHASHTDEEAAAAQDKEDIAVVPLAIPLMAGPGAISLVIIDAQNAAHWLGQLYLSLGCVAVAMFIWLVLRMAEPLGRLMGITGLNIATRIMGLLLAAIGVQFIADGLVKLFPGVA